MIFGIGGVGWSIQHGNAFWENCLALFNPMTSYILGKATEAGAFNLPSVLVGVHYPLWLLNRLEWYVRF